MGVVSSLMSVGAAIKHAVSSLATAYLDLDFSSNSYRVADTTSSFDAAFTGVAITGDAARTQIANTYSWTITDGGTAP